MLEKNYYKKITEISKGGMSGNTPLVESKEEAFSVDDYFLNEIKCVSVGTKESIDCIYKNDYFIEFKSGKSENIKERQLNEKIAFTMMVYFSEKEKTLEKSKKENVFYLIVSDNIEKIKEKINIGSAKSEIIDKEKKSNEKLLNIIKNFEGFCFKECDIKTATEFVNIIKNNTSDEK